MYATQPIYYCVNPQLAHLRISLRDSPVLDPNLGRSLPLSCSSSNVPYHVHLTHPLVRIGHRALLIVIRHLPILLLPTAPPKHLHPPNIGSKPGTLLPTPLQCPPLLLTPPPPPPHVGVVMPLVPTYYANCNYPTTYTLAMLPPAGSPAMQSASTAWAHFWHSHTHKCSSIAPKLNTNNNNPN